MEEIKDYTDVEVNGLYFNSPLVRRGDWDLMTHYNTPNLLPMLKSGEPPITDNDILVRYIINNSYRWQTSYLSPFFTESEVLDKVSRMDGLDSYKGENINNFYNEISYWIDKQVDIKDYEQFVERWLRILYSKDMYELDGLDKLKDIIEYSLIVHGWNPSIEVTPENKLKVKHRLESKLTLEMMNCYFIRCDGECTWRCSESVEYNPKGVIPYFICIDENCNFFMTSKLSEDYFLSEKNPLNETKVPWTIYLFFSDTEFDLNNILTEEFKEINSSVANYHKNNGNKNLFISRLIKSIYNKYNIEDCGKRTIIKSIFDICFQHDTVDRNFLHNVCEECNKFSYYCINNQDNSVPLDEENPYIMPLDNYTSATLLKDQKINFSGADKICQILNITRTV